MASRIEEDEEEAGFPQPQELGVTNTNDLGSLIRSLAPESLTALGTPRPEAGIITLPGQ